MNFNNKLKKKYIFKIHLALWSRRLLIILENKYKTNLNFLLEKNPLTIYTIKSTVNVLPSLRLY